MIYEILSWGGYITVLVSSDKTGHCFEISETYSYLDGLM